MKKAEFSQIMLLLLSILIVVMIITVVLLLREKSEPSINMFIDAVNESVKKL